VNQEVVIARLPERPLCVPHCDRELERVHDAGDGAYLRLAQEEMDVFRHNHVSGDHKPVALADTLQGILKEIAGVYRTEMLEPVITTEGEEVKVPCVFVPDESTRHWRKPIGE
jgi:hypothetical protein